MTKFKVGDKVKRIGHSNGEMIYGEVYTVEKSSPFGVKARGLSFSGYEPSNFELVETANSWDNCKIRIKDAEHSRIVQEEAFRKGFRWGIINKKVSHTDTRALYFERGEITFTERASTYFESKPSREIFFDGTQTEEFKQTKKVKK